MNLRHLPVKLVQEIAELKAMVQELVTKNEDIIQIIESEQLLLALKEINGSFFFDIHLPTIKNNNANTSLYKIVYTPWNEIFGETTERNK